MIRRPVAAGVTPSNPSSRSSSASTNTSTARTGLLSSTQSSRHSGNSVVCWRSAPDCVLLVNGDSPTLPPRLLAQAIEALRAPGDRMVLGPANDGGYYLIGLKHPYQQLFARIAWGTETVARTTCERAAEIGLATTLLPEWYDVDDLKTLRWLQDELFGHATRFRGGGFAAASRAFLKAGLEISP